MTTYKWTDDFGNDRESEVMSLFDRLGVPYITIWDERAQENRTLKFIPPKTLNGHEVLLYRMASRTREFCYNVLVKSNGHLPYVVATWNLHTGDSWALGHYFRSETEAVNTIAGLS